MIGARTLLINPPRINGVAFTRQGRCQEREEVLGTTKPPYTLAVIASLLRARGFQVRLIDQTTLDLGTDQVIDRLRAERFSPTLIVFPSTTPTLRADAEEMALLKAAVGAPIFCFGPHASSVPLQAMDEAPQVDGMFVGEPEDAVQALASLDCLDRLSEIPSLVFRRGGAVTPHRAHGIYSGFADMPLPAWDLLPLECYTLPLEGRPYLLVETSRGCPHTCDFCVAPLYQGHKFRERDPRRVVDEIAHFRQTFGIEHFYLWGDTVTLNARTFTRLCDELIERNLGIRWFGNARADNLTDPRFVDRLRASGCWMLSMGIESESDETRAHMGKRLHEAAIGTALANLRRSGIKSFAFFVYGYPGETVASMERTTAYALELDPDFANFYPVVPYPGTSLYDKCRREGWLEDADWVRMEYSYYLLRAGELNAETVMTALRRARRRFFLRPGYLARHAFDIPRTIITKHRVVREALTRFLFGLAEPAPLPRAPAARGDSALPSGPLGFEGVDEPSTPSGGSGRQNGG